MVVRYVRWTIPKLEELSLPPILQELIMEKRGLILVVGSTGSGKSTSLAAMIEYRNTHQTGHILTIEDPIEFLFRHNKCIINQREIGMDTLSYSNALVNALREAPDVMMIGEIRDRETLQHALIYAQTGHLCLSTMHANNSYHAMNRIINFFPHDARAGLFSDLSISLRAVISQRLVRNIDGQLVPAVEVLLNSTHISELIKKGAIDQIKEAMEQSLYPGSQTFEQALFKLYKDGAITLDSALKNSDSPTNLSWLINNSEQLKKSTASIEALEQAEASGFSSFTLNTDLDKPKENESEEVVIKPLQ
jgi:twitching motility protein PilU